IDQKLGGAFPVDIIVPLHGAAPTSPEGLAQIGAVQDAVTAIPGVHAPMSIASIAHWIGGADAADTSRRVDALLNDSIGAAGQRFTGAAGAVITVTVNEASTEATEALAERIEAAAHAAAPDAIVTGATVVTARESTR